MLKSRLPGVWRLFLPSALLIRSTLKARLWREQWACVFNGQATRTRTKCSMLNPPVRWIINYTLWTLQRGVGARTCDALNCSQMACLANNLVNLNLKLGFELFSGGLPRARYYGSGSDFYRCQPTITSQRVFSVGLRTVMRWWPYSCAMYQVYRSIH